MKKLIFVVVIALCFGCYDTANDAPSDVAADATTDAGPNGGQDASGPRITGMTVMPSAISQGHTGMTDRHFRVVITTAGLNSEVQNVDVVLGSPYDRSAPYDKSKYPKLDGNRTVIDEIPYTWFQGVEPGTYDVGATVETADNSLSVRSLAEVTVMASDN